MEWYQLLCHLLIRKYLIIRKLCNPRRQLYPISSHPISCSEFSRNPRHHLYISRIWEVESIAVSRPPHLSSWKPSSVIQDPGLIIFHFEEEPGSRLSPGRQRADYDKRGKVWIVPPSGTMTGVESMDPVWLAFYYKNGINFLVLPH